VRGETASFQGDEYRVNGIRMDVPGATDMPVAVAALGPVMLKLAGTLADGTITWMVGAKTMENHIVASLTRAAAEAGRPAPRVVGGFPIALTTKVDEAKAKINEQLAIYGQLPSYRAMLDREGAQGPADIAILGDENALRGEIQRLESAGVTDFNAAIVDVEEGARSRTMEFLSSLKG
jgi:alkanesulfonate monooxygenase SsuD/methylene tetrahydromethanopterin reductase-like flavin-dependent oxidoreductase (luciferase family)